MSDPELRESCSLRLIKAPYQQHTSIAQTYLLVGDVTRNPIDSLTDENGELITPAEIRKGEFERPFHLHFLHFNDMHGNIARLEGTTCMPVLSRITAHLRALQNQCSMTNNSDVMCFSGGDDAIGSPFDALMYQSSSSDGVHPAYAAYSHAGLNASVVGNHDLDLGFESLQRSAAAYAKFPLLSANLRFEGQGTNAHIVPAALFYLRGVVVGAIGLTTTRQIKQIGNTYIHLTDPIEAMRNCLPVLRSVSDVLVILSHLGYRTCCGDEASCGWGDIDLAEGLPRGAVDLIIGGHSHTLLNQNGLEPFNVVNGIPIVQAGAFGQHLGEVKLTIDSHVKVTQAHTRFVYELPIDSHYEETVITPLAAKAVEKLLTVLGPVPTDNVQPAGYFDPSSARSHFGDFLLDGVTTMCKQRDLAVDAAMMDASVLDCQLPSDGILRVGDWHQIMPFADYIRLFYLTGAELYALLQDNALRAGRPDEPVMDRGFLYFSSAIQYRIIPSRNRIHARADNCSCNDMSLNDTSTQNFTIVSYDCLRIACRPWEHWLAAKTGVSLIDICSLRHEDLPVRFRDVLPAYLRSITEGRGVEGPWVL